MGRMQTMEGERGWMAGGGILSVGRGERGRKVDEGDKRGEKERERKRERGGIALWSGKKGRKARGNGSPTEMEIGRAHV